MIQQAKPRWVFELWCLGASDRICANDFDLPIGQNRRRFWRVRGRVLQALFSWWWWQEDKGLSWPDVRALIKQWR